MYFLKAPDSLGSRICPFMNLDEFFVAANIPDYAPQLQRLMQQAGLSGDRELSQKAGVSEIQLSRLRRGLALQTRADILLKISQALQISLTELLATLAPDYVELEKAPPTALEQEYQRLQASIEQQRESLMEEFQLSSVQILESWMLQWPTAASKAQENHNLRATALAAARRAVIGALGSGVDRPSRSRDSLQPSTTPTPRRKSRSRRSRQSPEHRLQTRRQTPLPRHS
jgi:transcriptional regulator with XRE-family HTH domain